MFNIGVILIILIMIIIFYLFVIRENFTEKNSDEDNDNKSFFKMKPINPKYALWDYKIDYCLNRGGTLEDLDLNETLLNYKPKVILY